MRQLRSILATGSGLALLLAAAAGVAGQPSQAGASPEPQKRPGVWAQTYSDLKPEADVRVGTLPNGMRYALMRNATPAKQVSLRLRIGAGALEERDDQQGLAHFLEHMAFKGSTHVPGGDMIQQLQRLGLAFGPDTNASTGFDQTLYMLDLPQNDATSIDTGLMLLREIGGELTLAQAAMDPERGVVLSEERLRDTPGYQAQKAYISAVLAGQRVPNRFPIGKTPVLQDAPVGLIRQFYEAYYRPQNAILVAVGDIDLDAVEAKIRADFTDWKGRGAAGAFPNLGAVRARGEAVDLFVKPGAPERVNVAWIAPYDATADTAARERRDYVEELGLAVLNRRLERIAEGARPPFTAARASRSNFIRSAKVTTLTVLSPPQAWDAALAAAVAEQRRLVQYGVGAEELAREITEKRTELTSQVQGEATRRTPELAQQIVESAGEDEVFTGPRQNLATFDAAVAGLAPAQVDAALRRAFAGVGGPLISMSSPEPVAGGEAAVKAAFDKALSTPVAAPVATVAKPWPYLRFGPDGRVMERREVADLGVTEVRFANGARLTVKPTAFTKDQILVGVRLGRGLAALPKDRASPTWLALALPLGGTRALTAEDIERTLAGKVVDAQFVVGEDAFGFQGVTRPQDLATQMQLVAAYVTDPGFRPEATARVMALTADALPQVEASPEGVLSRDLPQLIHSGDARFRRLPTPAELAATTPKALPDLVSAALASDAPEITVVGDVTPEAAIAAVAATFGALPSRRVPAPPTPAELATRFPASTSRPVVLTHKGRADQAVALVAWPTTGFYADPKEARRMTVAAQVFENRLIDQVRVKEGATYSPDAASDSSQVFPTFGYVRALVETPPGKIANFWADVATITADMRAKPPTDDELARAKRPTLETVTKARQTNAWWLGVLSKAQDEPRQLDAIRTQLADVQAVTAADVQAVSSKYLTDAAAWRLIVRAPEPTPGSPQQTAITPRIVSPAASTPTPNAPVPTSRPPTASAPASPAGTPTPTAAPSPSAAPH